MSVSRSRGALLPSTEKGERRFGFEGIGILSGKIGTFTFHLNGGLGVERSTGDMVGIWGVIGELPMATGLRVVGEVNGEKPRREDQRNPCSWASSGNPGRRRNAWLDAGIRRGFTSGAPDWQFTLGVTFGFSAASLLRGSSSAEASTAEPIGAGR